MKWFSRLSFTAKLYLGFSTILSLSVIMSGIALFELLSMHKINRELRDNWMPSISTLRNITDNFDRYLLRENAYIVSKNPQEKAKLKESLDSMFRIIRENELAYEKLIIDENVKKEFTDYERNMDNFFRNSEYLRSLADQGKADTARTIRSSKARLKLLEEVRDEISGLVRVNVNGGINSTKEGDINFRFGVLFLGVFLIGAIITGVLITRIFTRDIFSQVGGEPAKIAEIAHQVSLGNLDIDLDTRRKKQQGIYASVKQVVATLKEVVNITKIISAGDTSQTIHAKSDNDVLAASINTMINNFKAQNHIKDGLNNLSKTISGNLTPFEIANKAISFVARFLESAQGAVYIFNKNEEKLSLLGTYAFTERNSLSNHYRLGEGLIGQVALEKKEILLRNVTRQDAVVATGLVQESPLFILASPLLYEDNLYGVLELASFVGFDANAMIFLNEADKIIATYLHSAEQNEQVKQLLQISEEAKALAEAKAQEVLTANVQLEQQQEELRAQAEELNNRTQELEIANAEMDELNHNLEQRIQERTFEINQQKEEIEAQRDNLERTNQDLEIAKHKSDELLLNILPYEIAEELKAKGTTDTRYYKLASVVFTDFEGFTQISSKMKPSDLVYELNDVFAEFDKIVEKHNLEKIKTIGDAYMCVGGVPNANFTNPVEAVLAALEIQRFMQHRYMERIAKGEKYWRLRVGINSGEVIAGVIGKRKFAYDIWGDAVNTAARMESNGEPEKVNISQNTYELVKEFFNCTYRGKSVIKGKGEMDMYFVAGIKPELSVGELHLEPNDLFYQKLKSFEVDTFTNLISTNGY
ncbi:MAG: MCP four helix bundle domain-containing protein [Microscillaceae bacterium]|jgi:class 3 adenylate cyclase/soluble cytochrome b562|nr:MCP four helix bundle domain-containing protein [Microscillaceae bacterium]